MAEKCNEYYDQTNNYHPEIFCSNKSPFCCGWCENRYCCNDFSRKNSNQTLCDLVLANLNNRLPNYNKSNPSSHLSLEAIIEITCLSIGILVLIGFIYIKIRDKYKRNSLIPVTFSMNSNLPTNLDGLPPPPYVALNISHLINQPPSYKELLNILEKEKKTTEL